MRTSQYTYLGGDAYTAPVAAVTQSGATTYYYLLRDHLGNITHQVNTANAVVAEFSFDACSVKLGFCERSETKTVVELIPISGAVREGRRRNATNWSYTLDANDKALFADRGFTGHESLKWFNLINMNGRLYDPLVGRFLNADNFIQDPTSTQNYNRYSYCLNNPLKYVDPSGWRMAAADEFWNLGKEITNFDRFYGFSSSGGNGGGGADSGSGGLGGNAYTHDFWNKVLNQGEYILNNPTLVDNATIVSRGHNVYGVDGLWVQTVNLTGNYQGWRDGVNSPNSQVNVINKFTADSPSSQGNGNLLNTTNTFNTWASAAVVSTDKVLTSTRLGSNIGYSLAYKGIGNATKFIKPVGVGTSIVGAGIGLYKFFGTENKTWGVYGQLGVSLLSSSLTLGGATAPIGIGIGVVDVFGGFNGFYNYLDNQQQFYNNTGGLFVPVNGIPY